MNRTTTFWFAILGALFFIIPSILGGFLIPDYNHVQQFISESYAIDTQYGLYIRVLGYIPSGVFTSIFAISAMKFFPKSNWIKLGLLGFALCYGMGTIVVGIFPCDAGCNREFINPSISQIIHNITGALTYLITPACLLIIGLGLKKAKHGKNITLLSILCGISAFLFSFLISSNPTGEFIGLQQRLLEASILFWLLNFALYIKNQNNV